MFVDSKLYINKKAPLIAELFVKGNYIINSF